MATDNISEKVDFMALRRLYAKNGNQKGLDKLIRIVFEKFSEKDREKLLAGVTVSEELLSNLDLSELIELLFLGACPKDLLIKGIMNVNPVFYDFEKYDKVFRYHFISIDDLQKVILGAKDSVLLKDSLPRWVRNVCSILARDDLEIYEGLDFKKLVVSLLEYLENNYEKKDENRGTVLKTYCNILRKLPYDKEYLIGTRILNNMFIVGSDITILSCTLDKMLKGKTIPEVIDLLCARPDLKKILVEVVKNETIRKTLAANVNTEELFNLMAEGKVGPVGLMLVLFKEIYDRRGELLNCWIKAGLELPIDVYMESIINCDVHKNSYEELDKKHMSALEEEKAKQLEIKPIEQQ